MKRCPKCDDIRRRTVDELLIFENLYIDRCPTKWYREQQAEKVRSLALAMHAADGHPTWRGRYR